MDIDAEVDAAVAAQTEEQPKAEPKIEEAPATENEQVKTDNTEEAVQDDPFPKKAVNAISRRDKKINKLVAERNEYQSKIEAMEARLATLEAPPAPQEPKMDDYDTFEDYIKDVAKFEGAPKQEPEAPQQVNEDDVRARVRAEMEAETRQELMAAKAQELVEQIPEYNNVLVENQDIIDTLPQHVQEALLYADNAPLAVYTLAKNDALENLAYMNAQQAAQAVVKAQYEGRKYLEAKPATKAPEPKKGLKGASGRTQKSLSEKSPDEILDWLNS